MNLSIVFGVQYWICLVATTVRPATRFVGDGDGKRGLGNSDSDAIQQQLIRQWRTVMGSSWWSASKSLTGDRNEDGKAATVVTPPKNPSSRPPKLIDGFFSKNDRRYPKGKTTSVTGRRHVIIRPKDAGDGKNNATVRDGVPTATTAIIGSDVATFRTESECVSANGGRLCACFMTDFLDSIGERLDLVAAENQTAVATAFPCPSYKSVPASFVVSLTANATKKPTDKTTNVNVLGQNDLTNGIDSRTAGVTGRREVDFDYVVNYELETSKNDSYAVHYGLVGSDIRVQCLNKSDRNNAEVNVFKWDYTKVKTNSTITGMDTNNLLISNLDPGDSKNYTCMPNTVGHSKNGSPYTHYVIAVKKQVYEIHGTAFYKTTNNDVCTPELINNVRKQLPSSIRTEICPLSSYACNVDIETLKCVEDEVGTLEIKYLVMLNQKSSYLTRIRISKKGQDVLYHQKLLARISKVLVENLNKSLTVPIMLQMSSNHTRIKPDNSRMKIKTYVSCSPGFGIREVFCAACPPHHYSPDKRADCLKCHKGFHQPIAGSEMCVKCPSIFASGCYMSEFPHMVHYVAGFVGLFVSLVLIASYLCICREKCETKNTDIENQLKKISRKFKKTNEDNLLSGDLASSEDSQGGLLQQTNKIKKLLRINKKWKQKIVKSKIPFSKIHKEFGRGI